MPGTAWMNRPKSSSVRAGSSGGGIAAGSEWEPYAGIGDNIESALRDLVEGTQIAREKAQVQAPTFDVPAIAAPEGSEQATQTAFGKILLDLAKGTISTRIRKGLETLRTRLTARGVAAPGRAPLAAPGARARLAADGGPRMPTPAP